MTSKLILTATSFLLASCSFGAIAINFSSPLFESARTSVGEALTSSFTFDLGTFNDFVPTSENVASWASNWVSFGTTPWNDQDLTFNGQANLLDNGPAPVGKDMYIWGYNTQTPASGTEWVLFDNDSAPAPDDWSVPSVVEPNNAKIIGLDQSGTTTILGDLFASGNDPYFQTAAVVPEPAHYAGILGAVAIMLAFIRRRR